MAAFRSYILCTAPRSGSTLLCKLLAATGVAGNPDSHFHRPSLEAWIEDLELEIDPSLPEKVRLAVVFQGAIKEGSLGGVFGLRLQRHSFDFFISQLAALYPGHDSDRARLESAFGRSAFIHLSRKDKLRQAISLVKAEQSGLWHRAPDGSELERLAPHKEPKYDAALIEKQRAQLEAFDREWIAWFEAEGIEPHTISYEELNQDPRKGVRSLLDFLGLDPAAAKDVAPEVAKLADQVTEEWATRFQSDQEE